MIKGVQMIFYLLLYFHVQACLLYLTIEQKHLFIPTVDWVYFSTDNTVMQNRFHNEGTPVGQLYWISFYTSVILIQGNEIGPRHIGEIIVCCIILIMDLILAGTLFGNVSVLVQMVNKKSYQFQEIIDSANTSMKNNGIPSFLEQKIRGYLIYTQATLDQQQELQKFLTMISPSLKQQVAISIFNSTVKKNKVLTGFLEKSVSDILSRNQKLQKIVNDRGVLYTKMQYNIIKGIVRFLSTQLNEPEDTIIKNFDDSTDMYIIAKGAVEVKVIDGISKKVRKERQLLPGDYFGEISLIYNCRRTAQVVSLKYSTLGKLSRKAFRRIITEYPQIICELKEGIYQYKDPMKKFLQKSLQSVPYFQDIEQDTFHDILYGLEGTLFEKDDILQKPGQDATALYILQSGVIDVYTQFEGFDFSLSKLFKGSILNYRTFFMENNSWVYLKFLKDSILLELPYSKVELLCEKHRDFGEKFYTFQKHILIQDNQYPLDCIINIPKALRSKTLTYKEQQEALRLQIFIKNFVLKRIQQIRVQKAKPGLKEMIVRSMKEKNKQDEKMRKLIKKRVEEASEYQAFISTPGGDVNYCRILSKMDRMFKILIYQLNAIDSLEVLLKNLDQHRRKEPLLSQKYKSIFKAQEAEAKRRTMKSTKTKQVTAKTMLSMLPEQDSDSDSDPAEGKMSTVQELGKLARVKDDPIFQNFRFPVTQIDCLIEEQALDQDSSDDFNHEQDIDLSSDSNSK